jgi:hypothetical protein
LVYPLGFGPASCHPGACHRPYFAAVLGSEVGDARIEHHLSHLKGGASFFVGDWGMFKKDAMNFFGWVGV